MDDSIFDTKTIASWGRDRFAHGMKVFGARFLLEKRLRVTEQEQVWLVLDTELNERRELKFLPPAFAHDRMAGIALKKEAAAGRKLSHPRILKVDDFLSEGEFLAVSREAVGGENLLSLIEARADLTPPWFEPEEIETWVQDLVDALSYAHEEKSMTHRSLNPECVFIDERGHAKVADFGIGQRIAETHTRLTGWVGNEESPYSSPQVLLGERPTAADDIYAFGATVYHLLTGHAPRRKAGKMEAFTIAEGRARTQEVYGLDAVASPVPKVWEDLVAVCLAPQTDDRVSLIAEITAILAGKGTAEQIRVEEARLEKARKEKEESERAKAEQARAEKARVDQARAQEEKARLERETAEKAQAERVRIEKARAEQAEADRVLAEKMKRVQPRQTESDVGTGGEVAVPRPVMEDPSGQTARRWGLVAVLLMVVGLGGWFIGRGGDDAIDQQVLVRSEMDMGGTQSEPNTPIKAATISPIIERSVADPEPVPEEKVEPLNLTEAEDFGKEVVMAIYSERGDGITLAKVSAPELESLRNELDLWKEREVDLGAFTRSRRTDREVEVRANFTTKGRLGVARLVQRWSGDMTVTMDASRKMRVTALDLSPNASDRPSYDADLQKDLVMKAVKSYYAAASDGKLESSVFTDRVNYTTQGRITAAKAANDDNAYREKVFNSLLYKVLETGRFTGLGESRVAVDVSFGAWSRLVRQSADDPFKYREVKDRLEFEFPASSGYAPRIASVRNLSNDFKGYTQDKGKPVSRDNAVVKKESVAGIALCWIPKGSFRMGMKALENDVLVSDPDESPHDVVLSQGFWLGQYEVTQDQWNRVMRGTPKNPDNKPCKYPGGRRPVENVTWAQANAFCRELTRLAREAGDIGQDESYQLPTEAQWEYACGADRYEAWYPWGMDPMFGFKGNFENDADSEESRSVNTFRQRNMPVEQTMEVGKFSPNKWGLYDMVGNVWEWCRDYYWSDNRHLTTDPFFANPDPGQPKPRRSIRGGSFGSHYLDCRSSARHGWLLPTYNGYTGFRIALVKD